MAKRVRRTPEAAREEIMKATEACLHKDGPDGLRLVDVAERAGMHHSNVLHHFGSREGLIEAFTSTALERGVQRAARAFGESLAAAPDQRAEALAKVFDVVQQEGIGRLFASLILGGRVNDVDIPDFEPLVRVATGWQRASFGSKVDNQSDEEIRLFVLFLSVLWMGEAVGGEVFCQALKLPSGPEGLSAFRRWMADNVVQLFEYKTAATTGTSLLQEGATP